MAGKMGRELTLRRALKEVEGDYDIVLIDCPPALGLLTVNALVAADYALLSAEAQYFALQGVEQALEVIELARDGLNPDLEWLGVLFNIADMRTVHSREAYDALKEHVGDKLLKTVVRQSIAYAESAERAVSILEHRPDLGPGLPRARRRAARAPRAAAPRASGSSRCSTAATGAGRLPDRGADFGGNAPAPRIGCAHGRGDRRRRIRAARRAGRAARALDRGVVGRSGPAARPAQRGRAAHRVPALPERARAGGQRLAEHRHDGSRVGRGA